MPKKRVIVVGTGSRGVMYWRAAASDYPDTVELVGLCDVNPGRVQLVQRKLKEKGKEVPGCAPADLEKLIRQQKASTVVVTSMDRTHDEYICRGMLAGCDVITEKPMTTTAEKCQRIVDTIRKTGRSVRVTFNYRYSPFRSQVKELLLSGVIGRILSVEFKWLLDTSHGADYFRRWHRNRENSGGLMVHKATHHFDAVNWYVNSVPVKVAAIGARRFYTPEQALRYGFTKRSERCLDCPEASRCPFHLDLKGHKGLRELYLDHESHDGYFRDRCVFSSQIDIQDTMNLCVEYRNGVVMSYALTAFSPWEGYHIAFNGTRGRLEHLCRESSYVSGTAGTPGELLAQATTIHVMPHFTSGYLVPLRTGEGGHGGGDRLLLDDLFAAAPPPDPVGRRADWRAGAYSILTGVAANLSMDQGRVILVDDLVKGLELPDYPDESKCDEPIRLPEFVCDYGVSDVYPKAGEIHAAPLPPPGASFCPMRTARGGFMDVHPVVDGRDGFLYFKAGYEAARAGEVWLLFGADGPSKLWFNGHEVGVFASLTNPSAPDKCRIRVPVQPGPNELLVALDTRSGNSWGIFARFAE